MRRLSQKVPIATSKRCSKSRLKFLNIQNAVTIELINIFQCSFYEMELQASASMLSHCHEQNWWQFKENTSYTHYTADGTIWL